MKEKPARLRVLVVDDEWLIRWSLAETLSEAGYAVVQACDGREAMDMLTHGPAPDVILLDFRLPDSSDLKLLANIRRVAPASAVIMMTAFGTPAVEAGALELGAFRVIGKPLEMRDVEPLVRQAYDARP